jgi:hypothetical protein
MDPGVTESTVQFETVRKMKSAFVNLYQASVDNASTAVIVGKEGEKQLVMGVPIYHGWYDRAKIGMHHRMGYKVVRFVQKGSDSSAGDDVGGMVGSAIGGMLRVGNSSAGVLCVSRLRAAFPWRRSYQDRTFRSAEVFC